MSPAALAWAAAATLLAPVLPLHLARRARRGKEIAARLPERRGLGAARPPGRLFWLHAASVGEMLSALPLIEALAARAPDLQLLVTTGSVTSAELLARRLPPALAGRVRHRFVPLDVPGWAGRFLDGWRPDAAAFVESELWPNLLAAARRRGIPMALVNARISPRSAAAWARAPGLLRATAGAFRLVLARSEEDRARLAALGIPAACWGDLKTAAPPLPADPAALAGLRAALGARPAWLAASTHPGEEALAARAHAALRGAFPDLLTVVVPRHPDRGAALAAELAPLLPPGAGRLARRAAGEAPGPEVGLYLADTLGEMGLFLRLADPVLVGGSLVPHGGQNPLEPARLGRAVLFGPHMHNFTEAAGRLLAAGGALSLPGPEALAPALADMLRNAERRSAMGRAAAATADRDAGLPERIAVALAALLPSAAPTGKAARGLPAASPALGDGALGGAGTGG